MMIRPERSVFLLFCCLVCLVPVGLRAQAVAPGGPGGKGKLPGGGQSQLPSGSEGDDNEQPGYRHLWEARMQGGSYMVLVGKIAFVSKHEYVSDGVARVVEVTVAAEGSAVARFYYLEPAGADSSLSAAQVALEKMRGLARDGAQRVGQEGLMSQVVKNYPTTTHAHTVEYRLQTEEALESLYRNLARTMANGKGRVFREPVE